MSATNGIRLWSILGNSQRLDGGAMFGNVPRAMWSQWIAPDEQHRIPLRTAAFAAIMPLCESSITRQAPGSTPSRRAASEPKWLPSGGRSRAITADSPCLATSESPSPRAMPSRDSGYGSRFPPTCTMPLRALTCSAPPRAAR